MKEKSQKIEDVQEYWCGMELVRIFWLEGRVWVLADDMVDILDTNRHNFILRGTKEADRAMLYGDFLGQPIGENGLAIVTLQSAIMSAARMPRPKAEEVARWLICDVVPNVYRKHETYCRPYYGSTVNVKVEVKRVKVGK